MMIGMIKEMPQDAVRQPVRTYDVLLERAEDNGYTARILAWPDNVIKADTQEEALAQARTIILERLARAEIVPIEIEPDEIEHPWLKFAGTWANDPGIDEFRTEIERYRREIDAKFELEVEIALPPLP